VDKVDEVLSLLGRPFQADGKRRRHRGWFVAGLPPWRRGSHAIFLPPCI
jgi:hypothetical protein